MISLRALLIEDSEDDAILLVRDLQKGGFDVKSHRVDNKEGLLAALKQQPWDIVFCDYTMPGQFNAFTALDIVKNTAKDTPFIIVSGTIGEERAVAAMKAGAQDYLIKGNTARLIPALQRELQEANNRRERIRAEEERARLISIIGATTDLVGISDNQLYVHYLNMAGRRMLGIGADENITGFNISDAHPEWLKAFMLKEAIPIAIRRGIWNGESALLSRDGHVILVSQVIIAHKGPDGNVQYFSTVARDITQRKKMEKELAESNHKLEETLEELQRAQSQMVREGRLDALRQMAGAIVHDVNNLLTPINGFTELLLSQPELLNDTERVRHDLEMINMAGKDVANVIRRLRLFYQVPGELPSRSHLDINTLVKQATRFTEPRWKSQAEGNGISIRIETDLLDVPPVEGDEVELREVITNLILNAVDAMNNGGTLMMHTQSEVRHVVLEVKDTGCGMTQEIQQHCFEPFFTTKGAKGTGLGLAIAYGVVHKHGGDIAIESQVGQGTTVTIRLPVALSIRTKTQQPVKAPSRQLNIMVVDDDAVALKTITAYLASEGHTVSPTSSGHQALEMFIPGKFDVVMTDLAMPIMDGHKLANAIKQRAPRTPVIIMSGFADQLEALGHKPKDVDIVLNKPVDLEQLRRALGQVSF